MKKSTADVEQVEFIRELFASYNSKNQIMSRIRKRWLAGGLTVASIGPELDLTYPAQMLGNAPALLAGLRDGSHPFAGVLKNAKKPMLILGAGFLPQDIIFPLVDTWLNTPFERGRHEVRVNKIRAYEQKHH
jgi:hypothetical protein